MLQAGYILEFGLDVSSTTDYGLMQSYEIDYNVQRAVAIAPDGAGVSIQEHMYQAELSLSYIPLDESEVFQPEIGELFIFNGSTWNINNIVPARIVDGFAVTSLEATWYPKTQD